MLCRDASNAPADADNVAWADLYNTTSNGTANYVARLAQDFNATAGSVAVQVPDVDAGSYFVMCKSCSVLN